MSQLSDIGGVPRNAVPAGLVRRLAALAYDLLLLAGLVFIFTLIVLFARGGREIPPGTWWFELCLLAVSAFFFIGFWTHGGQTLGMRAWRLRLVTRGGERVGTRRALGRFLAAFLSALPAGLGFWWALVDEERACWHDRWTGTRMLHEPAPPKRRTGA